MKTYATLILLSFLTIGVYTGADAQRNRGDGGGHSSGENRQSDNFSQRNTGGNNGYSQARPSGDMGSSRSNTYNAGSQRSSNYQSPIRENDRRFSPQRSVITRDDARERNNNYVSPERNQGVNSVASGRYDGNRRYSGNNNYAYNSNRYSGYYRNSNYGGRYHFMSGPRYRIIPRNSVSIYFGGNPYYYNDGFYYGYYGGYYQPIFPPVGLRVGFLPYGYSNLFIGGYPYYYSNGIYYRQYEDNNYVVVDPPMGATVTSLPKGAKSVVLNGEDLYELNGTYYREDRDANGEIIYTVVGKNGSVNNSEDNGTTMQQDPNAFLQEGDIINQLPQGSKAVTIDGNRMYVTPENTYLKEETDEQGTTQYRVVGR